MNKIFSIPRGILLIFCFSLIGMGCGGGGGGSSEGGGGGESNGSIEYTGLTTPAVITNANAREITEGAFSGGSAAAEFGLASTSESNSPASTSYSDGQSLYSLSRAFSESTSKISINTKTPNASERFALAISTESGTIDGDCGGSATYNFQVNDQTGEFTGTFVFSNYCDAGTTINGSTTVSGTIDLVEDTITTITYTFDQIEFADVILKGTINIDDSDYPPNSSTTFNMLIENVSNSKVYKFENYLLSSTEDDTSIAFEMTGTYYDPDYGYVTVSTPVDFIVGIDDEWPSSGEMLCVGANGGQTKLTALDNGTYNISVDSNGDSAFETVLGPYNWSDL